MNKFLVFILAASGAGYYLYHNLTPTNILAYAQENPGELAPRLAYYAGMIRYQRREFSGAVDAFQVVVSTYPASRWGAESQYRLAAAWLSLLLYVIRLVTATIRWRRALGPFPESVEHLHNAVEHDWLTCAFYPLDWAIARVCVRQERFQMCISALVAGIG